jgi:hypothetical protein
MNKNITFKIGETDETIYIEETMAIDRDKKNEKIFVFDTDNTQNLREEMADNIYKEESELELVYQIINPAMYVVIANGKYVVATGIMEIGENNNYIDVIIWDSRSHLDGFSVYDGMCEPSEDIRLTETLFKDTINILIQFAKELDFDGIKISDSLTKKYFINMMNGQPI